MLQTDAIRRADVAAVRDRMRSLNQFPRIVLRDAVLRFLAWMPANGGGVEEDLRALDRGEPRAFGKPLVPANEHADLRVLRVPRAKPGVPWREIELLVIARGVRHGHVTIPAK